MTRHDPTAIVRATLEAAAKAADTGNDRCEKCGHTRAEHHYRHPFMFGFSADPVARIRKIDPSTVLSKLEAQQGPLACPCVSAYGPNPDCGRCGGSGDAGPVKQGRFKVPAGQTPLDDDLRHPLLDVFNAGMKSRDDGTASPYHGHSLENCIHASGWVLRDIRLALDAEREKAQQGEPWQDIATAPKDRDVLVWFDHSADSYQDPYDQTKLTDYAAWAEGGDFLDGSGMCVARWQPQFFEATDDYGSGYWLPAAWFSRGDNAAYETVCNATHWMPFPPAPTPTERRGDEEGEA